MGFLLNSNKPIKYFITSKLPNQSIFCDAFMLQMISNSFYESKSNFLLIKRKTSDQKREISGVVGGILKRESAAD